MTERIKPAHEYIAEIERLKAAISEAYGYLWLYDESDERRYFPVRARRKLSDVLNVEWRINAIHTVQDILANEKEV